MDVPERRLRFLTLASLAAWSLAPDAGATEATQTPEASPAQLTARIADVESLVEDAAEACSRRPDEAQAELDAVNASRSAQVMFPEGWARAADDRYRIHQARADCTASPDVRASELRAAAEAARAAVRLYRDEFDYRSMVILQFNVAASERALGEDAIAVDALVAAIQMDLEYGFRDDAKENYRQLLAWKVEKAEAQRIAALIEATSPRIVKFKFGWTSGASSMQIETSRRGLIHGQVVDSHTLGTLHRLVTASSHGLKVAFDSGNAPYELGVWPSLTDPAAAPAAVFPPVLPRFPDMELRPSGELKTIDDPAGFAAQLADAARRLIRDHAPPGADTTPLVDEALRSVDVAFAPEVIEAAARQSYNFETAMWIGARLEQGVWYALSAPLTLPGVPRLVGDHDIAFSFTHAVPCTAASADPRCVELVVKTNEPIFDSQVAPGWPFRYSASRVMRIVVDPQNLLPYSRDVHSDWYMETEKGGARDSLLESERLLETTTYP